MVSKEITLNMVCDTAEATKIVKVLIELGQTDGLQKVLAEYDEIANSLIGHPDGVEADFVMRVADWKIVSNALYKLLTPTRQVKGADTPARMVFEPVSAEEYNVTPNA